MLAGVVGVVIAIAATGLGSSGDSPPAKTYNGYCNVVRRYKKSLDQLQPTVGGPDVGSQLANATGLIQDAKNNAPSVIKADMEVFAGGYEQVAGALARAGYEPQAVGIDALQPLETPAFAAALARIATYDRRVCQID